MTFTVYFFYLEIDVVSHKTYPKSNPSIRLMSFPENVPSHVNEDRQNHCQTSPSVFASIQSTKSATGV